MQSVVERLVTHMRTECALLTEFHDAETAMKARIHRKDWDGLESVMDQMTGLADRLVETEQSRHSTFEELRASVGEGEEASFYRVIVHLEPAERDTLADLYRTMKFSVFGIQTAASCMDEQVRSMNETMHDILGELYPHRKGSLYSKSGTKRPNDENPLLIDREL